MSIKIKNQHICFKSTFLPEGVLEWCHCWRVNGVLKQTKTEGEEAAHSDPWFPSPLLYVRLGFGSSSHLIFFVSASFLCCFPSCALLLCAPQHAERRTEIDSNSVCVCWHAANKSDSAFRRETLAVASSHFSREHESHGKLQSCFVEKYSS